MKNEYIFFKTPAVKYIDAIPVGNGRLGAMVCGGVKSERINLNDDTLWSGFPRVNTKDFGYERFTKRLRNKILIDEDFDGAEDLAERLQGPYNESFIPAGEFVINFFNDTQCEEYVRGLDMKSGIAFTKYTTNGVTYQREVFASFIDDVIVIHLSCNKKGAISFCAEFDSMIRHNTFSLCNGIALKGRAPRHIEPEYLEYTGACLQPILYDEEWERKKGLRFECHAKADVLGGNVKYDNGKILVENADDAYIYLWVGTNFSNKFCEEGGNVEDYCIREMDIGEKSETVLCQAMKKGYELVKNDHILDMNEYYNRVCFEPEYDTSLDMLPTDERKLRYQNGMSDAGFEKQIFDFGRYLLYSSSRPGSQAANLQGIWCWEMRPAWSSNYTININTQMNYWGVEVLNMPECHMPLMNLLCGIANTGKETALQLYGARGFCAHHNIDIWRSTCPIGNGESNSMWSLLTTGGIWLSLNVWEHYLFTRDLNFLKKHYHIIKGASLFAIDMMCEMKNGYLGICPTTVPERRFTRADGKSFCVGAGSTFDYEIVSELFDGAQQAALLVDDNDEQFINEMKEIKKRFPAIPLSEDGKIMFWQFDSESTYYIWIASLYGIYPGYCLHEAPEEVVAAAKKTLTEDDITTTCFGNCWYAGAWARLGQGNKAYKKLRHHISNATINSLLGINMSYNGKVFQIDSNLGIIATMGEMFVQSTPDTIILAPALADEWKNGCVTGLKTRNACRVDLEWKNGITISAKITSPIAQTLRIMIGSSKNEQVITFEAGMTIALTGEIL